MSAVAGYVTQQFVRSDTTTPTGTDQIDGLKDVSLSLPKDMLETTNFKAGGYKLRLVGLTDSSADLSGDYIAADAPLALIRSSWASGATLYFTFYVDPAATSGNKGWRVPMLVSEFSLKAAPSSTSEWSAKLVGNGAPVAV
jgi:predicted secreted protein